jgi:tetratricopeptide (TPR) repeat protein
MRALWLSLCLALVLPAIAGTRPPLVEAALAAEARLDAGQALELYLQADRATPNDPFILQKIARQYSDLVADQADTAAKLRYARTALGYAERAVALEPKNAVNVLSLAVCHGKLALCSETGAKLEYSRLVKTEAEQALALDPDYAWAHHVLGRWHREVASLGATTKFLARLFYSGLPAASTDEAVRQLRRATELEPDELNHWIELGFAYAAAGQPTQARIQWQRGLAMPVRAKPDLSAQQRAREALARLD